MELDDANLVAAFSFLEPGLGKDLVCTVLGHREADDIHGAPVLERGRVVGHQRVRHDFNRLVFQVVAVDEVL